MKIYLTEQAGELLVAPTSTPSRIPGCRIVEATPEQEADILAGKTYWTPELDAEGRPTGNGTLSTPPHVIPSEIANWRARAVLELAGLLATVEALIAGMEGEEGIVVRAAWDRGAPLVRHGQTVTSLAAALDLTSEQVDAMFLQAASLNV